MGTETLILPISASLRYFGIRKGSRSSLTREPQKYNETRARIRCLVSFHLSSTVTGPTLGARTLALLPEEGAHIIQAYPMDFPVLLSDDLARSQDNDIIEACELQVELGAPFKTVRHVVSFDHEI